MNHSFATDQSGRSRRHLLGALILIAGLCIGPVADAQVIDAGQLMQLVYDRDDGDLAHARLQMSINRGGQTRERRLQVWWRKFEGGTKRLLVFESPGDIKNSGLLTLDYDAVAEEDGQWLYLQSLHKVTRLTTAKKSESFMGSDFSFADITKPNPASYEFSLDSPSEMIEGEDCAVIDARPADERTRQETGYLKAKYWVSKDRHVFRRIKVWVEKGRRLKFISFGDWRLVAGVWTSHQITARTMLGSEVESETVLSTLEVGYGQAGVTDALFTQRRLEQGL